MHHLPRIFTLRKQSKKMEQTSSPKPKLVRRNAAKNFEFVPSGSSSPSPSTSGSSAPRTRSLDLPLGFERTSFRIDGSDGEFDLVFQSLGLSGPEDFEIPKADWDAMSRSVSDVILRPKKGHFDFGDDEEEEVRKQDGDKFVDTSRHRLGNDSKMNDVKGRFDYRGELEKTQKQDVDKFVRTLPHRVENDVKGQFDYSGEPEKTQKLGVDKFVRTSPHRFGNGVKMIDVKGHLDYSGELEETQKQDVDKFVSTSPHRFGDDVKMNDVGKIDPFCNELKLPKPADPPFHSSGAGPIGKGVRIKGDRPPLLTPPPAVRHVLDDGCSTWDLMKGFAPDDGDSQCRFSYPDKSQTSDDEEEGDGVDDHRERLNGVRIGETVILSGSCSFTTTNDDDSSSTTTEPVSIISPNSGCRFNITHWEKGNLRGRGSFGTVYEGISSEGFFFAVKEVSLLEQGSQGKQSIYQLEQEIQLLSQFEHENIVQYLGTDKDDSKLYIFLELVTQGSLSSLYQKYHLRDSHVSAYTRQILLGLKYLHDKNVVHRDIKCANILVASNGMVKLADFGLAKATRLNDLKSCKGTAFWMAPEVVNHKNQGYGLAADIWSLGCTVLEMITGHVPYYPLEFMQALFRIGKGEPPPIPDTLSRDTRDFIKLCLRVNPNDRPTAAELLEHPFVQRPLNIPLGSESPMLPSR